MHPHLLKKSDTGRQKTAACMEGVGTVQQGASASLQETDTVQQGAGTGIEETDTALQQLSEVCSQEVEISQENVDIIQVEMAPDTVNSNTAPIYYVIEPSSL